MDSNNLHILDTYQDSASGIDSISAPVAAMHYNAQVEVFFAVSDTNGISHVTFEVVSKGRVLTTVNKTFDQRSKRQLRYSEKGNNTIPIRFQLGSLQIPLSTSHLRVKLYNGNQLLTTQQRKI
ncbi:MAG: hypothetical protein RLP14_02535 [Owenweeksia sp.]